MLSTKNLIPYLKRDLKETLTIVEIGTGEGADTKHLLENVSKIKTIHTVDPYTPYGKYTETYLQSLKTKAIENLKPWIESQKVYVYGSLDDLGNGFGEADVLIIDADQTYTGTLDLLNRLYKSVSKKGIIAVSGVAGENGNDVKRAIAEFRKQSKQSSRVYVIGDMWFWYTPGEMKSKLEKAGFNPGNYSEFDSYSQLDQDLWVLHETNKKRTGFFVEFGASDGVIGSNSLALEKIGWRGILAEPNPHWHDQLKKNRPDTPISFDAVYKETGKVLNLVCPLDGQDLVTLDEFRNSDYHSETRKNSTECQVTTISLNDLLEKYDAPTYIDYMSIDTEGSEYEILESFDFQKYTVKLITVEHNYSPETREKIHTLLSSKGYKRVYESISRWDDWYIKE